MAAETTNLPPRVTKALLPPSRTKSNLPRRQNNTQCTDTPAIQKCLGALASWRRNTIAGRQARGGLYMPKCPPVDESGRQKRRPAGEARGYPGDRVG